MTLEELERLAKATKGLDLLKTIEGQVQSNKDSIATQLGREEFVESIKAMEQTLDKSSADAVKARVAAVRSAAGIEGGSRTGTIEVK